MKWPLSPRGSLAIEAAQRRAAESPACGQEQAQLAPYEAVVRQVIALRASHSVSQDELAVRVGTSHSQISRIASGQHRPSVETPRRIAEACDAELAISFEPRVAA